MQGGEHSAGPAPPAALPLRELQHIAQGPSSPCAFACATSGSGTLAGQRQPLAARKRAHSQLQHISDLDPGPPDTQEYKAAECRRQGQQARRMLHSPGDYGVSSDVSV